MDAARVRGRISGGFCTPSRATGMGRAFFVVLLLLAGLVPAAAAKLPIVLAPLEIHEGEMLEFSFIADPSRHIGAGDLQVDFGRQVGGSAEVDVDYRVKRSRFDPDSVTGSIFYAARDTPDGSANFFVEALADDVAEGDEIILFRFTDGYYLTYGLIPVTLKDGRRRFSDGVTVSESTLSLIEGHASRAEGHYAVALNTDPGAEVKITVTSGDASAVEVDADSDREGNQNILVFTPGDSGNWKEAQTVTVRAVEDGDTTSERDVRLTHVARADRGPYGDLPIASVEVEVTDAGHGVLVDAAAVSVAEGGGEVRYQVRLKSQPSGKVEITPASAAPARATVGGSLIFTPLNWSMPQAVVVIGRTAGQTILSHAISDTDDAAHYPVAGRTIPPVSVTVTPVRRRP